MHDADGINRKLQSHFGDTTRTPSRLPPGGHCSRIMILRRATDHFLVTWFLLENQLGFKLKRPRQRVLSELLPLAFKVTTVVTLLSFPSDNNSLLIDSCLNNAAKAFQPALL
jgi:hypothetical protein